jgi:hypothetical protein
VAFATSVPGYSGGPATELHRVPFIELRRIIRLAVKACNHLSFPP